MRVSDHAFVDDIGGGVIVNLCNEWESILTEEFISKNELIREIVEKLNLFIIPYSGLKVMRNIIIIFM